MTRHTAPLQQFSHGVTVDERVSPEASDLLPAVVVVEGDEALLAEEERVLRYLSKHLSRSLSIFPRDKLRIILH